MITKKMIYRAITTLTVVVALACAFYIMRNRMGLSDELDFGAGAYYYTDIPNYEKIVREDVYEAPLPYWVHAGLFLVWGWIMYRLWEWVDGKK